MRTRRGKAFINLCLGLYAAGACCIGCRQEAPVTSDAAAAKQASPVSRRVEEGPLRVTVELDRDRTMVPEPIQLTLTVEVERGVEYQLPEIEKLLGAFVVQNVDRQPPKAADDVFVREVITATLEPVVGGEMSVPPLTVAWRDSRERADGSPADPAEAGRTHALQTPEIPVEVEQRLADVKGPEEVVVPASYVLAAWIAGVLAVMTAVALAARRLARRSAPVAPKGPPPQPAHLWALAQLDMLAAEGLVERGLVREWYYRVNAIVRQYIERRYGTSAGEQTSEEFLRELQRSPVLTERHKDVLQRFVSACDPVKYARHRPDVEDVRWVETTAREFVMETAEGMEVGAEGAVHSAS